MIGVLLVTHGPLGENLIEAAAHVLGSRPQGMEALVVSSRAEPCDIDHHQQPHAGAGQGRWRAGAH